MKELIMLIINLFSFMNLKNKTGTNIENKPISLTKKSLTQGETANLLNIDDYNIVHYNILNGEITYENFDENNYVKRSRTLSSITTLEDLKLSGNNIIINKIVDDDNNEILYSEGYNPNNESKDNEIALLSEGGIYGEDDRTTLQPSQYTLFPYRAVCRIFVEFDSNNDGVMDGNGVGTGVFVGPSTILTCNHIMYSKEHGWPDRIEIGPGAYKNGNKIEYPNGKITSWSSLSIGNNHNTGKNDDDWAIIDLDANYGSSLGYFGVSSTAISVGSTVRLYGYHGDIPDQISYGPGTVTYLETYKFYHNCDAISGSSGGPITYGTTTVVGIHSGGVNQNEDAACKVSSYIVGWINERLNS